MRNWLKVKVDDKYIGRFLVDFLKEEVKLSSRMVKRLSFEKQIYYNKKPLGLHYKLKGNEEILINLDRKESQDFEAVNIPLSIIYEDSSLIVIDKDPFMVVHPTAAHQNDTLANGLLYYYKSKGEDTIVRLISRLDMNTSGLVMCAKNQFTHSFFSKKDDDSKIEKVYLGIACGYFKEKVGSIEAPIIKESEDSYRRVVREDGQYALTLYKVLDEFNGYSLVEYTLKTGRTHQIRVHSKYIGHPLVNDELYEGEIVDENPRQFLHAHKVTFKHPLNLETVELISELPQDMNEFIKKEKENRS